MRKFNSVKNHLEKEKSFVSKRSITQRPEKFMLAIFFTAAFFFTSCSVSKETRLLSKGNWSSFFGNQKKAISRYNEALEIDPSFRKAYDRLEKAYLKTGQLDLLQETRTYLANSDISSTFFSDISVNLEASGQTILGPFFPLYEIGSPEKNYVLSVNYLFPNKFRNNSSSSALEHFSVYNENHFRWVLDKNLSSTIQYYDELGRKSQGISIRSSPEVKDLITPIAYNQISIIDTEYLPYTNEAHDHGLFIENALNEQREFYRTQENVAHSDYPFSKTVHELSPLLRVKEQGAPGAPWQPERIPNTNTIHGHTIKSSWRSNKEDEVLMWVYEESQPGEFIQTIAATSWKKNQLFATEIVDENGSKIILFTDKQEREVLKRVVVQKPWQIIPDYHDTYYVYDKRGNLKLIISPEAVVQYIAANRALLDQEIREVYLTEYYYDTYDRLVRKRLPGIILSPEAGIEYVYDCLNRPILTRDLNLRARNEWLFTKFDKYGREILTGKYTTPYQEPLLENFQPDNPDYNYARDLLQNELDLLWNQEKIKLYEERRAAPATDFESFYTNRAFPSHDNTLLLTITYYDDYDFNNDGTPDVNFIADSELTRAFPIWKPFYRLKNHVTGSRERILLPNAKPPVSIPQGNWLDTRTFYDQRGRVIQTQHTNALGGTDINHTVFDFPGRVLKIKKTHQVANENITIRQRYKYDHAGRVTGEAHQINDQQEVWTANYSFNELGQQVEKNFHRVSSKPGYLQSIDYSFNIRGWLQQINRHNARWLDTEKEASARDLFILNLIYGQTGIPAWPYPPDQQGFNGNITGATTNTYPVSDMNDSEETVLQKQGAGLKFYYGFNYDDLNQLTTASFDSPATTPNPLRPNFSTTYKYDRNGNFVTLRRHGMRTTDENGNEIYGEVDNLSYKYSGNQVTKINDAVPKEYGFNDFKNGEIEGEHYFYDLNGNLIRDLNKGLNEISYNYLNLPEQINFPNSNSILWNYSSTGSKLRKVVLENTSVKKRLDYIGGYVYENGALNFIQFEHGRLKKMVDESFRYEYNLMDHLDNVRVSFTQDPNNASLPIVLQEDHYYPFGLKMHGLSRLASGQEENKFTFNGKEFEDDYGLDWYHYGVRFYDPQIGRWHVMDLAEEFHSPYNYVGSNPITFSDHDGLFSLYAVWNIAQKNADLRDYLPLIDVTSISDKVLGFGSSIMGHGYRFEWSEGTHVKKEINPLSVSFSEAVSKTVQSVSMTFGYSNYGYTSKVSKNGSIERQVKYKLGPVKLFDLTIGPETSEFSVGYVASRKWLRGPLAGKAEASGSFVWDLNNGGIWPVRKISGQVLLPNFESDQNTGFRRVGLKVDVYDPTLKPSMIISNTNKN